jgi:hypothetical protein
MYDGKAVELVQAFIEEEYKAFPVGLHDDMLDALSRMLDPEMTVIWPKYVEGMDRYALAAQRPFRPDRNGWMAV